MASLTSQLETLERERDIINDQIECVQREITYQNKNIDDLEGHILNLTGQLNEVLTYLRNKYNKRYKLDMGYLDGKSINIQIIEPKGGKNGYDRYLQ